MTKVKVEKIIVISFIGLIVAFFVGLGGNIVLKAGLPVSASKAEINFENRLQILEENLVAGTISKIEYDSMADIIRVQKKRTESLQEESPIPEKMPDWVILLGITEPQGMQFDPVFSDYTSVDNPAEGFNSVSLTYTGSYEKACQEAARIAKGSNLRPAVSFLAKGSPYKKDLDITNTSVSYLNYSLGDTEKDFLISLEVEPSGRLNIMVTNNKQLNDRLLVYTPLNNRQNGAAKQKKQ